MRSWIRILIVAYMLALVIGQRLSPPANDTSDEPPAPSPTRDPPPRPTLPLPTTKADDKTTKRDTPTTKDSNPTATTSSTSTNSPTSSPAPNNGDQNKGNPQLAATIGIAIAGVVGGLILISIIISCVRRRRRRSSLPLDQIWDFNRLLANGNGGGRSPPMANNMAQVGRGRMYPTGQGNPAYFGRSAGAMPEQRRSDGSLNDVASPFPSRPPAGAGRQHNAPLHHSPPQPYAYVDYDTSTPVISPKMVPLAPDTQQLYYRQQPQASDYRTAGLNSYYSTQESEESYASYGGYDNRGTLFSRT